MDADNKKLKRRRRKNTGALYVPVMILLVAAVIVFGIGIFFRVASIEVVGNKLYTTEDILRASGLEVGGSMLLVDTSGAKKNIAASCSSIDSVNISKQYPDRLIIEITESYPVAFVKTAGESWLIDQNARLLGKADGGAADGLIAVSGAEPINPTVGQTAALGQEGSVKLSYLRAVLSAIVSEDMQDEISWVDMTNISDITFDYLGRFTVRLGKGENVRDKLAFLEKVAATYDNGMSGRIDLSTDGEAHVIPG